MTKKRPDYSSYPNANPYTEITCQVFRKEAMTLNVKI